MENKIDILLSSIGLAGEIKENSLIIFGRLIKPEISITENKVLHHKSYIKNNRKNKKLLLEEVKTLFPRVKEEILTIYSRNNLIKSIEYTLWNT